MHTMFEQAPISSLAIMCMKTVLENGSFNVVSFMLLFQWKALNQFPWQTGFDVFVFKVSPTSFVVPWDSPSLSVALLCDGFDGFVGIARGYLPDSKTIFVMRYQFPSASTLHLASLELHGIVVLCKLSIVGTLIGTISIQLFNCRIRDTFTVFHRLLKKMTVCKYSCFHLNGSDDAGLAFLYSFCEVGYIALHILVVLTTIGRIWIVRILKTVSLYLLLVSKNNLSVLYDIREFGIRNTIKKLNRQLEKVADSFGSIIDI